jgi:hypothetical protein
MPVIRAVRRQGLELFGMRFLPYSFRWDFIIEIIINREFIWGFCLCSYAKTNSASRIHCKKNFMNIQEYIHEDADGKIYFTENSPIKIQEYIHK